MSDALKTLEFDYQAVEVFHNYVHFNSASKMLSFTIEGEKCELEAVAIRAEDVKSLEIKRSKHRNIYAGAPGLTHAPQPPC